MFTIVGLGNPGNEYVHTRHNVAWVALENIMRVHNFPEIVFSAKYAGAIASGSIFDTDALVVFPHTYMNNSGSAVQKCISDEGDLQKLIVVADEIDLPLGDVRVSWGRGSGGHNGIQSVIGALGTKDFTRIRIGIGAKTLFGTLKRPKGEALSRYVLGEFTKREEKMLQEATKKVARALELIVTSGVEQAMNEINSR